MEEIIVIKSLKVRIDPLVEEKKEIRINLVTIKKAINFDGKRRKIN